MISSCSGFLVLAHNKNIFFPYLHGNNNDDYGSLVSSKAAHLLNLLGPANEVLEHIHFIFSYYIQNTVVYTLGETKAKQPGKQTFIKQHFVGSVCA